jgi:hypothetical protein
MNQKSYGYVKVAVIPLLGWIFYSVLSYSRSAPVVIGDRPAGATADHPTGKSEPKLDSKLIELSSKVQWPEFSFNELANVDPLDRRMIFPEPLAKAMTTDPKDSEKHLQVGSNQPLSASPLASFQIQAVFQSQQGIAALIGERIIRIGDRLKDGAHVIGITPHEITVEPPTTH